MRKSGSTVVFVLAVGCGSVDVAAQQRPCQNVDPTADPELRVLLEGADVIVEIVPNFRPQNDVFRPEFEFDGRIIKVHEDWESKGGSELCISPGIRLIDPPAGTWQVQWYSTPEDLVPEFLEEFDL